MKYSLAGIYDDDVLHPETEQRLQIKHEDGTSLLTGCGDCGSPWTDDREKLNELIELANLAAAEQKHIKGLFSGAEDRQQYLDSVAKDVK